MEPYRLSACELEELGFEMVDSDENGKRLLPSGNLQQLLSEHPLLYVDGIPDNFTANAHSHGDCFLAPHKDHLEMGPVKESDRRYIDGIVFANTRSKRGIATYFATDDLVRDYVAGNKKTLRDKIARVEKKLKPERNRLHGALKNLTRSKLIKAHGSNLEDLTNLRSYWDLLTAFLSQGYPKASEEVVDDFLQFGKDSGQLYTEEWEEVGMVIAMQGELYHGRRGMEMLNLRNLLFNFN